MAPTRQLASLFYDLRARVSGLQGDLKAAETQFGKLSTFVKANPVAAISALGVALAGVALKAAKMASEVETSLKRVANAVPNGIGGLDKLREGIASVSRETGKSQAELARNLQDIARMGVEGPEQALARLKAIQTAVDATGEEFGAVTEGLDQTLDLFGGASEDAARALGTLFAAAKGRTSLSDVFASLQGAAPTIRNFKLDIETSARALVALGESGLNSKKAAAELKRLAESGETGRAAIKALADSMPAAADGFADMQKAADDFNNSAEGLNKRALADFQSVMIDLGRAILPGVTRELRNILDLIDRITGTKAKRTQALGLSDLGSQISDAVFVDQENLLGRRSGEFVLAAKALAKTIADGQVDIVATTSEGARKVAEGVQRLVDVGLLKADEVKDTLAALSALATKTQSVGTGKALRGGSSGDTTAEEIEAQGKAAEKARDAIGDLGERLGKLGTVQQLTTGEVSLTAAAFADLATDIVATRTKFPQFADDLNAMAKRLVELRQAASGHEIADLRRGVEEFAAKNFGTVIDELGQRFDDLIQKLEQSGHADAFKEEIDRLKLLRGTTIESEHALDSLAKQFEALRDASSTGFGVVDPDELQRLLRMADAVRLIAENENTANDVRERAKKLLEEINQQAEALGVNLFKIPDVTEKVNKGLSSTTRNLLEGAQAAIALANAMGLVDDKTAQALDATVQLATSIIEAVATAGKEGIPGIIASVFKLGKLAFGQDPAAQKRAKELEENTDQLAKLNRNVGDLVGLDLSGKQIGDVRKGTEIVLAATGDAGGFRRFGDKGPLRDLDPKHIFEKFGIPFEDVQKVADRLGIKLNGTKQSFIDLHDAIVKADLAVFFDTFAGQLEKLDATNAIHGITDPIEILISKAELLAKTSPMFAKIFEGLDLNTLEGRAEATRRLREQWDKFMEDPEAFRAEIEASGLSLEEWKQQALEMNRVLAESAIMAARVADAFSDIDLDLAIAGDTNPVTSARLRAAAAAKIDPRLAPLGGFNLATAEGRAAATQFLQSLAIGANEDFKKIILELLQSIRAIPEEIADAVPGETKVVTSNAQGLLEVTGNRMADYLRVGNLLDREQIGLLTEIRDRLSPFFNAPPITPVQAPAFAASLGAGAPVAASRGVTVIMQGGITVEVPAGVVTNQSELTAFLSGPLPTAFVRKISEGLSVEAKAVAKAQGGRVVIAG